MDDEEKRRKIEADAQLRHREWTRRSQDIIRVFNPLDKDFRFLYDGYPNTVKSKSYKDMERFKARLFAKKIIQEIIGQEQVDVHDRMMKARAKRNADILDPYQENVQIWDKTVRINDKRLWEVWLPRVIVGLVEEYGKEEPLLQERITPRNALENEQENVFNELTATKIDKETISPAPVKVKPLEKEIRVDE